MMLQRQKVNAALKAFLEENTARPFSVLRAPKKDDGGIVDYPYGLIVPRTRGNASGPPFSTNPWADYHLTYDIKSIGRRHDQADALADRVREVLLGRDEKSQYTFDLQIDSHHTVIDRRPGVHSPGDMVVGGTIFEVDDAYVIVIQTS